MKNKINPFPAHHAYLVFGTYEELAAHLGGLAQGADFWRGEFDAFGIDDSRMLKERAVRKAMAEGGKKIFVISANSFTLEAQNSLLKLFEEPTANTHFFILTPSAKFLIPTLLSRLAKFSLSQVSRDEEEGEKMAKDFLKKTKAERIAFAAKIAKDENGRQKTLELLESLTLHIRAARTPISPEDAKVLSRLLTYREYLSGRSPSSKIILETAALLV